MSRQGLFTAGLAAALAYIVGKLIKDFFYYPRPFPLKLMDGSFPSVHTAVAFGFSFVIFKKFPRLGTGLLIFSVFVGISRIAIGVHTPLDILGGVGVGYLCSLIVTNLTNYHS